MQHWRAEGLKTCPVGTPVKAEGSGEKAQREKGALGMNECNQPEAEQRLSGLRRIGNIFSQHRSMEHYRKKEGAMERERDGGTGGGKTQRERETATNHLSLPRARFLFLRNSLSLSKSHQ